MIPAAARVHAPQQPHGAVPTLTEVVDMAMLVEDEADIPAAAVVPLPAHGMSVLQGGHAPALGLVGPAALAREEDAVDTPAADLAFDAGAHLALTENVLRSIQKEVDAVLDQRLKDALVPILARCAESMMQALREDLASTLHEIVSSAVAGELNRVSRN